MLFEIPKKKDIDGWIELGESKIKVDYLTDAQEREVKDLEREAMMFLADLDFNSLNDSDLIAKHPNFPKYERKINESRRLFLRYCVKDWDKAAYDPNTDEFVPCKLVGNRLSDKCYDLVIKDDAVMTTIYLAAKERLEFTETDKKKSNLQSDSETKAG